MKIKRYFAPDIRQAIRKVRDEQGPDAVILSNQRVNGGIEIVAAIDYDESLLHKNVIPRDKTLTDGLEIDIPADITGNSSRVQNEKTATRKSNNNSSNIVWSQEPALVEIQLPFTRLSAEEMSELS